MHVDGSKVFGIGLCKTGTKSLSRALSMLGLTTIHYPHDRRTYDQLRSGDFHLDVMRHYQAATDLPVAYGFARIDAEFPGSKFILTVRDKSSWLRSAEHHWQEKGSLFDAESSAELSEKKKFALFMAACVFGCHQFNEAQFSLVYDRHGREVKTHFENRRDDLLVLDICRGDAWGSLCAFLGKPVPEAPFPHLGRTSYPTSALGLSKSA